MRFFIILGIAVLTCTAPQKAFSEVGYYTGTMQVLKSSGKACRGLKDRHAVEMVISTSGDSTSGYVSGEELVMGKFTGSDRSGLTLQYPYQDQAKANGHFISINTEGDRIIAELRDRHIEADAEDCNFDLARLTLNRVQGDLIFEKKNALIGNQFQAQLLRSEAIDLVKKGRNAEALPLYEQALVLVDAVAVQNPKIVDPYITSLANSYMRAGRYQDFNRLYDERINSISDQGLKVIFTGYRVRILMDTGKAALAREEYDKALVSFQQAYRLHPQGKETIAGVMAAEVRAGNHDSAIAFLEEALKKLETENDRENVRVAIAMVLFQKSKKDGKNGKTALAEVSLRKAISYDPDTAAYQVALARLRHKLGDLKEAEALLARAMEHFKDEPSRQELIAAREKLRLTDRILAKLRRNNH